MQYSVPKKMKHRNCFKVYKIASPASLFSRSSGINVPDVHGLVDNDERMLDSLHRTNQELNSEMYEYYAKEQEKLASEEDAGTDSHREEQTDVD